MRNEYVPLSARGWLGEEEPERKLLKTAWESRSTGSSGTEIESGFVKDGVYVMLFIDAQGRDGMRKR